MFNVISDFISDIKPSHQHAEVNFSSVLNANFNFSLKVSKFTSQPKMKQWAIITGGGTGIGAALAQHFALANNMKVLIVDHHLKPLTDRKAGSPENITFLEGDITEEETVNRIDNTIPSEDDIKFVVQNAAVGDPGKVGEIDIKHFEYAFRVNVIAPLMLTQKLLPRMKRTEGNRILHVGTGVAFMPQLGTATYGITKLAFHRLYEQLRVELQDTEVSIGSARPGIVDTEGLWHHYELAKNQNLPHTIYFDQAKKENKIWSVEESARFLAYFLTETTRYEYSAQEWNMDDETHWPKWKEPTIWGQWKD